MFDVQALRGPRSGALPEPVLASIAAYYRRVTTDARPMNQLIGLVMIGTVLGSVVALFRGDARARLARRSRWRSAACRSGWRSAASSRTRSGSARAATQRSEQSALARKIARDHVACFAAMLGFVAIQLFAR